MVTLGLGHHCFKHLSCYLQLSSRKLIVLSPAWNLHLVQSTVEDRTRKAEEKRDDKSVGNVTNSAARRAMQKEEGRQEGKVFRSSAGIMSS